MERTRRAFLLGLAALLAVAAAAGVGPGAPGRAGAPLVALPPGVAALVTAVSGEVEWAAGFGAAWHRVETGDRLPPGALIRTGTGARLDLDLGAERSTRLSAGSLLVVAPPQGREAEPPSLQLFLGRVWVNLRRELSPGERFTVETPAAVVGVRGTMFTVSVAPDGGTLTAVHRGKVDVSGGGVTVRAVAEEEVFVAAGQTPGHPRPLSPEERAEWDAQRGWAQEDAEVGGADQGGGPDGASSGSEHPEVPGGGESGSGFAQKEGKTDDGQGSGPGSPGRYGWNS
ncbi:MAG TPA: FecR domain-containing protein [Firmicutes bacterium]|nr:FecR domain-containing protein [Bacillota bacterium]